MWQTKYALAVPKNLGVGVNFRASVKAISALGICSLWQYVSPQNQRCILPTPKLSLLFVTVVLAARAPKLTAALHKVPWDLFALWGHLFLSFFFYQNYYYTNPCHHHYCAKAKLAVNQPQHLNVYICKGVCDAVAQWEFFQKQLFYATFLLSLDPLGYFGLYVVPFNWANVANKICFGRT